MALPEESERELEKAEVGSSSDSTASAKKEDPKIVEEGESISEEGENKVLSVFQNFDSNNDGFIDRNELQQVLGELDASTWTDRRLGRLLNALDRNRDGKIQYKEFVHWACSPDSCRDLEVFRSALEVSVEDGKTAPSKLPARRASSDSAKSAPLPKRDTATIHSVASSRRASTGSKAKQHESSQPETITRRESGKQKRGSTCTSRARGSTDMNSSEVVVESCGDPSERLVIFDYDGTISVDKDERFKGFRGERLARLQAMVKKVRASQVRCILVTAQFPATTQETTIPSLQKTGVCGLFENEALDSQLKLYWDDEAHGTIYNGAKVMLGKIDLIKDIINGKNCWKQCFDPANVLFIDDDARNFRGNESVGIWTRLVAQDGMVDEDMDVIEAFAVSGRLPGASTETTS